MRSGARSPRMPPARPSERRTTTTHYSPPTIHCSLFTTHHPRLRMAQEDEQIAQRKANLEALARLGVQTYPHRFETTHTVSALVEAHAETAAADLEAARVETTTA